MITTQKQLPLPLDNSILNHYDSSVLFSYYVPSNYTLGKGCTKSNLRNNDNNSSFGVFFYGKQNTWLFKDLGTGVKGNVFYYVQLLFGYTSYFKAVCKVAFDFGLIDTYFTIPDTYRIEFLNTSGTNTINTAKEKSKKSNFTSSFKITIYKRNWNILDKEYWFDQYFITKNTLNKFNVFPITHYKIEYPTYFSTIKCLPNSYAYQALKDGVYSYKIYQPYANKENKWTNNITPGAHFGYLQLPNTGDFLIITKSGKDVMCIYDTLNIPAIAVQSETQSIKDSVMEEYQNRFKKVFLLFDNDEAGKIATNKYLERYKNIIPIIFKDDWPKDYSDFISSRKDKNLIKCQII